MIYRFDGVDCINDENGEIAYDGVSPRIGDIMADLMTANDSMVGEIAALKIDKNNFGLAITYLRLALDKCPEKVGQITGLRRFLAGMAE